MPTNRSDLVDQHEQWKHQPIPPIPLTTPISTNVDEEVVLSDKEDEAGPDTDVIEAMILLHQSTVL